MSQYKDIDRRSFVKGLSIFGAASVASVGLFGCSTNQPAAEPKTESKEASAPAQKDDKKDAKKSKKASAEVPEHKPSFMTAPEPIKDSEIKETIEADLIVVGAGPSGLITALSAVDHGLKPVLIAQSENVVARGGSNAVVNSRLMPKYNLEPIQPRFILEQMAQNSFNIDVDKWFKWYKYSEESVNWLLDKTENVEGLTVTIEQGNEWDDKTYPLYGPAMSHCWNSKDYPIIADGQPSLVLELRKQLEDLNVPLYFKTEAKQLVRGGKPNGTDGRVDAVIAEQDGVYKKFVGKKAVVLATGDFSGDKEMMQTYAPEIVEWVKNWDEGISPDQLNKIYGGLYKGDGHKMGLWVGAAWQKTWPCAGMVATFAAPSYNPWNAPDTIMVTDKGKRFCNEEMGCGHLPYVIKHVGPVNAIFDVDFPKAHQPWHNWKNVHGEGDMTPDEVIAAWEEKVAKDNGSMYKADTIEELCDKMGIDKEETLKSVQRYNELCDKGQDEDFLKRKELMVPIKTAPFYGWRKEEPTILSVMGGLRTDINMKVCDKDDSPIEGLYNVGTMIGDCYANSYNFLIEGHNHGMNCITYGYLTGKYIAENEK